MTNDVLLALFLAPFVWFTVAVLYDEHRRKRLRKLPRKDFL